MSAQPLVPNTPRLIHDSGYKPAARGRRARGRISVQEHDRWTVLTHHKPFVGDPLDDLLGAPGLWRAVPGAPPGGKPGRGAYSYIFEIPPGVAPFVGEVGSDEDHPLSGVLSWARATSGGCRPDGDGAPSRAEVESWIEPTRRHVRAGSQLAAIDLLADGTRLGLAVPSLVRLPAELSPARVSWVRELLLDAQARWHQVRFGIDGASVRAEVDLSGAPPEHVRPLFEIALAALTTAATWALPALAVLVDPRVGSRLLDQPPSRDTSRPNTKEGDA